MTASATSHPQPLGVYLDRNDRQTMSHRSYVDRLASEFEERSDIRTVDTVGAADVVHLNYLNPFGRVRHAKESVSRHIRDLVGASGRLSTPLVLTEHGALQFSRRIDHRLATFDALGEPSVTDTVKTTAQRLLAKRADTVIAVSDWVATALREGGGIPSSKVRAVHHGVDEQFENTEPTADDPFVFHLSKYSEQKNPETILEVGRRLPVPLVIAGRRWDKNVADLPNGVEVRGYVSSDELISLYNCASAFFFPSLYESFGLPIVEAMRCGTPVVGSDCGSVPEVIGGGGVAHGPFETEAFVDSLERLVSDREYRTEIEERAASRAEEFSWERTAEQTVAAYRTAGSANER